MEALYLYAWSALYPRERLGRLCGNAIFVLVLLAGLVYLVRIGALDWTPARSRRTLVNETDGPLTVICSKSEAIRWIIRSPHRSNGENDRYPLQKQEIVTDPLEQEVNKACMGNSNTRCMMT